MNLTRYLTRYKLNFVFTDVFCFSYCKKHILIFAFCCCRLAASRESLFRFNNTFIQTVQFFGVHSQFSKHLREIKQNSLCNWNIILRRQNKVHTERKRQTRLTANTNGTAGKKKGAKSANGRQRGWRRLAKSWNNMGTEETNKTVCGLITDYLVKLVKHSSASWTKRAEIGAVQSHLRAVKVLLQICCNVWIRGKKRRLNALYYEFIPRATFVLSPSGKLHTWLLLW